jgi:hypothetical protein
MALYTVNDMNIRTAWKVVWQRDRGVRREQMRRGEECKEKGEYDKSEKLREGGGVLRGKGEPHISSSLISLIQFLHTIILYSSYIQHLNIWHCINELYIKLHGRLYDREEGVWGGSKWEEKGKCVERRECKEKGECHKSGKWGEGGGRGVGVGLFCKKGI